MIKLLFTLSNIICKLLQIVFTPDLTLFTLSVAITNFLHFQYQSDQSYTLVMVANILWFYLLAYRFYSTFKSLSK